MASRIEHPKVRAWAIIVLVTTLLLGMAIPSASVALMGKALALQRDVQGKRVVAQRSGRECGVACVAMLLLDEGRVVDYEVIRSDLNPTPKGLNLLEMKDYLNRQGLKTEGIRANLAYLKTLKRPAIIHVRPNHYQVLDGYIPGRGFKVRDPEAGVGAVIIPEWAARMTFKGVALELVNARVEQ